MIRYSHITAVVAALVALVASTANAALVIYYEEPFSVHPNAVRQFEAGELNGQHGWQSIPGFATVMRWGQTDRRTGVGVVSRGAAFGFETLVTSPTFASIPQPTGDDYVMTMQFAFDRTDVSWYVTPKNLSNNRVVTRVKFAAGGGIFVLVPDGQGGGAYEPVPNLTWEAHHNYTLVLAARADGRLQISLDQRSVAEFNGASFIQGIEAISIETSNERAGRGMLFGMIKVRDGRINRQ